MEIINNNIENIYPLTSLQYGMLFHNLYEKDSSAYVIQLKLKIYRELNAEIIKDALKLLSHKNSILRTFFVYEKINEACQVVLKERELESQFTDLSNITKNEQEIAVKEILEFDLKRGFDLQKESLMRLQCIKLFDKEYLLIFTNHHIIMDGWCNTILFKMLFNYYERLYQGESYSSILKEIDHDNAVGFDYGDYLKWLGKQDKEKAREYWEEVLEGYDNDCDIKPMNKPLTTIEQVRKISIEFDSNLTERFKATTEKTGSTINTAAETAVGIMLQVYTGSQDVVFGKVVSGRNADIPGIEDMVGLFINTIPIRVTTVNEETISELLKKQQQKSIDSTNYDYYSLADIQSMTVQGSELIKVLYVFENYTSGLKNNDEDDSDIIVEGHREQTNYGLTITGYENEDKLIFDIEYDPNKYCEEEVKAILERLKKICEEMADNPDIKVSDIETVTSEEKTRILNDFNATETEYPRDKTVVELFEEQVKKTPDNIALVFEDKKLTYAELNARANRLAHKLRDAGIKPDDFVAIIADRSVEMICGIYGIIKAGGAYVPIDPTYPEDRIAFMFEDCSPKAVLKYTTESITISNEIPVIDLADGKVWEGAFENPEVVNKPEDAIYCIYTSGTTGKPKGSLIEHRSVVRLVKDTNYIELDEHNVILQTGSMSFDASTLEVWGAFLNGGKLVITTKETITDNIKFRELINKEKVNTMWLTSTLFNQMISEENDIFDNLEHLLIGGEKLSDDHVRIMKSRNNGVKLTNGYGPTENTTFTTTYDIPVGFEMIPIGKPIANTKIYIMNENNLCGIGVPGELCTAGDGVARGYLNRPELTAEKFVKNPYGEGKMYRTGDLARWLPDGNIEYLGRIDEQVKIRGFRIELGEIESRIREIENIKDCAVIAKADASGDKAIYAYYTSDNEVSVSEIRDRLSERLPEYMVPEYIMEIESIPVTRNGKLDRRVLPEIEVRATKEYIAPRNEIEEKICDIFSEILNVERVGVKDGFFELGGHSLRATRLVNRIEAETGTRIALKEVFSHPTVEQLAVLAGAESEEYVPIPKAEEKEYYPMSSAQKRTYLIQQIQPEAVTYNMPGSLKLTDKVCPDALRAALQTMTDRHEILRTQFLMIDGEPVQKILDHVEVDFDYVTSSESDEKLMTEFLKPFDLASGKLVRVKLINKSKYHLLMFDMHHIVSDGMSMNIFENEIMAICNGEKLEPLTHQFKDYSEWMKTRDLSNQAEYWKSQFDDDIPVLNMPTDYPRPQEQSYAGSKAEILLDETLSENIKQLANKIGATSYMVFLAAAMVTLSKYSRQEDIVIGSPISGRTHRDIEGILGMFVNTLAMRGKPEKNKTFFDFLTEIQETCLKAYENQEYPFEELVEAVDVQRDMSRNPLFDVMLILQNNENIEFKLEESKAELTGIEGTIVKFDLIFNIEEIENRFEIILGYCTDLYKAETAEEIIKHFVEILKAVTSNEKQKLGNIEMVTADERKLILNDFNATDKAYEKGKTIVELFEERVNQTPNNIAFVFEDEKITYAELNSRANSLAYKLREIGVKPNDFVAIIADKSLEIIEGVYGIIKSGGAYVPIDTSYPEDRIKYMLEDCKPKAVLKYTTQSINISSEIPVIDLVDNSVWEGPSENLKTVNKPDDLIYCIYTSGTTGTPKGVMIEHSGINRLIDNVKYDFNICSDDVVLLFASISFDASVSVYLAGTISGAKVVLPDPSKASDPAAIKKIVEKNNINILQFPPQFAAQYEMSDAKIVFTSGSEAIYDVTKEIVKYADYINAYGPTETTVCSTYLRIKKGSELPDRITIGRPHSNVKIHILNDDELCGIGVPGELCIAGDGIAKGYLNRPDLTAEKFVKDPFGEGRMYRTGDLARWLPDGNIDFLGRIDEQVKIRGFRIELGEIESRIREIENIKDCAVIAKADASRDKAIYAYYTSESKVSISEIKDRLNNNLPDYMMPAYMMQIDEIPMTRNGKLDKKALPEIESKSTREYIAPRNKAEEAICAVFCEVMNVEKIGIQDSFFEFGGDSIKAIQIISKLRNSGYNVTVKDIMNGKTPEKIALYVKNVDEKQNYEQGEVTGKVESTPIIKRFGEWALVKPEHYNQSAMISVDEIDNRVIYEAVNELVKHHDILRAVYKNKELEILPIAENKLCDFYEFDYSSEADKHKAVENKCNEIQESIDLEQGPLVKVAVFELGETKQMMFCIHHLAIDGISWRILQEDFETAVSQIKAGKKVTLPEKTASFIEWSQKLKEYGEKLESKEKEYWKNASAKISEGHVAVEYSETETGNAVAEFSKETTEKLLTKSSNAYDAKVDEVLLAGLARAVGRITGQKNVAVMLEGHGREEIHEPINIDRTVGWFTNIYVVSLAYSEDNDEAIISAKDTMRSIPNMGMGYGYVKNDAEPEITFNYLGDFSENRNDVANEYSTGNNISKDNNTEDKISLNGLVSEGKLVFSILSKYGKEFAVLLKTEFEKSVNEFAEYCAASKHSSKMTNDNIVNNKSNIKLTYDQFIFNNTIDERLAEYNCEDIASEYVKSITEKEIINLYKPSYTQKHLYEMDNNTVFAKLSAYNINSDDVISILNELIRTQEIFRTAYDIDKMKVYNYSKIEIPVLNNINYEKWISSIFTTYKGGILNKGGLLSRIFVIKNDYNQFDIYFICHHSISDATSGLIIPELFNNIANGNKNDYLPKRSFSDVIVNKKKLSKNNENKIKTEDFKKALEKFNNALKKENYKYAYIEMEKKCSKAEIAVINDNNLKWLIDTMLELLPDALCDYIENRLPFILIHNGRTSLDYSTLGMFLSLIIGTYNSENSIDSIIKELADYRIKDLDVPDHLEALDDQLLHEMKNVPFINIQSIRTDFNVEKDSLMVTTTDKFLSEVNLMMNNDQIFISIPILYKNMDNLKEKIFSSFKMKGVYNENK